MTAWLDAAYRTPHARLVASGFGGIFELMVAAAETGDLDFLRSQDHEWTTVIQNPEYSRIDDLSDLYAVAAGDTKNGRDISTRDALRLLRAVYRLATIAWLLDGPGHPEVTKERLAGARQMATHFRDPRALTFVAGRAVDDASDRRVAWWKWMLKPAGEFRVVTGSFIPALVTAYLSLLMDAVPEGVPEPELELPAERWIEEYRTMLSDGMNRAWPVQSDPSYWMFPPADDRLVEQRQSVVARKLAISHALDASVAEVERAKALRIRRASIKPELRELFIVTAQRAWGVYRSIGPVLHALGAPEATTAPTRVPLVERTVPKAGFVGETSDIHVSTYAEELGVAAAGAEHEFIIRLAVGKRGTGRSAMPAEVSPGVANNVVEAIDALKASGYTPSLVIAPGHATVWSRLQVDPNRNEIRRTLERRGVGAHLLRYVQAGIGGLPVLAPRGLALPVIVVIDAERGLAVPATFALDGQDLDVTFTEPDAAAIEQELAEDSEVEQRAVGQQLEQRMEQLDARARAGLRYRIVDLGAIRLVRI
jgi:hypothetical protein